MIDGQYFGVMTLDRYLIRIFIIDHDGWVSISWSMMRLFTAHSSLVIDDYGYSSDGGMNDDRQLIN